MSFSATRWKRDERLFLAASDHHLAAVMSFSSGARLFREGFLSPGRRRHQLLEEGGQGIYEGSRGFKIQRRTSVFLEVEALLPLVGWLAG